MHHPGQPQVMHRRSSSSAGQQGLDLNALLAAGGANQASAAGAQQQLMQQQQQQAQAQAQAQQQVQQAQQQQLVNGQGDPFGHLRMMPSFPQQSRPQATARRTSRGSDGSIQPMGAPAMGRSPSRPSPYDDPEDPVRPFVDGLKQASTDPQQRSMWTELIRLKTRHLELQIADARAKERAAELELHRLQQSVRNIVNSTSAATAPAQSPVAAPQNPMPVTSPVTQTVPMPGQAGMPLPNAGGVYPQQSFSNFPLATQSPLEVPSQPFNNALVPDMSQLPGAMAAPPVPHPTQYLQPNMGQNLPNAAPVNAHQNNPMTVFDLEAMLEGNNLDNFFSWLPDNEAAQNNLGQVPHSAAPSDLVVGDMHSGTATHESSRGASNVGPDGLTPASPTSPAVKRPMSPDSDDSPLQPAPKRGKPRGEKKIVIEQHPNCMTCQKPVARVLLRAPRSAIPSPVTVEFRCPDCTGVRQPPVTDSNHASAGAGGAIVGSTEARKRMRTAMEDDDMLKDDPMARRCFCDVCQRVVATGQVVGGPERSSLMHMSEIVCAACDAKYQRCTDCGGGGGPRVGIGKWRLKQVFQPGRKTCSLSHSRLGDRPREIGVHVTPTDFTPEQLKEVITRCHNLWTEKTLSRLAVPEMLEIDLPNHVANPLRNFQDVQDIVTRCWPSREAMIRADGVDLNRFKRMIGLTWAHSRPRRSVRTVDLEEEYARNAEAEDDDMSTVLANVKRTNVVIPAGSELIGMWGGEWDTTSGSLLVSTLIPFEGTDGEDSTALSVGELISKVQQLQQQINEERVELAAKTGSSPDPVRPCEHLWVVSGGSMPLIRERMADILVRKRSFVHVEEYLTRHPDFLAALQARPVGLHPDLHRPLPHQVQDDAEYQPPQPLVLVRWLGKDFDAQRIQEIKQMEFGGGKSKGKVKKTQKGKA